MDSNIKQWHKSVLFACVALLALGGTAMAQPSDYISGPKYILNAFTASADGILKGAGVWAVDIEESYQLRIYDDLTKATSNSLEFLGTGTGEAFSAGYFELLLGSPISITAGETYYARVRASDTLTHGASFAGPLDDEVSYFSFSSNGATGWTDLNVGPWTGLTVYGGGVVTSPAKFVMDLLTSPPPNISAARVAGTWTIDAHGFTAPKTLDMDLAANEMKPFVTEIEVDSDMSSITLTEDVLNDIADRDWIGYGFQLGFWDDVNDRFISSTAGDGLSFGFSSSPEFSNVQYLGSEDRLYFSSGLVEPGESAAFQLLINLPGGVDNFTFALRQYAVPEPSSFLLLAMSGVMMLLCGRRRR